ncbi:DUF5324 family protein [Streptomyces sp. WMMC905]|uniref:DUF5324 family protein n=1 Tax=Streptomyces sp. WMMC905 TaxID=3404123 RepID=UPI003B956CF6
MTRIDSVRAATGTARNGVLHAAEVAGPCADTAKDRAAHYAHEARVRLAPRVALAADQARTQYGAHVVPRLEQARSHVPPTWDAAAQEAAFRTRIAARHAADYSRPKIEQAVAAAGPAKDEAVLRGAAALAALRGSVSAEEIERLARKRHRRAQAGQTIRTVAILGLATAAVYSVWRWWEKQSEPDWLVEPADGAFRESGRLTSVDGTRPADLDADPRTRQAEGGARDNGGPR